MTFPSIRPTTRQFTPPIYPFVDISTMNKKSSRMMMASKPGGATLNFSYDNIPDATARQFITSYEYYKGSTISFSLPTDFLAGLGSDFANYVRASGTALTWRWDSPPKIDSVSAGLSNVTVVLKAYISPGTLVEPSPAPSNPYTPSLTTDSTKYPSFSGSTVIPPTPPTPKQGKKWISFSLINQVSANQQILYTDSSGNIYHGMWTYEFKIIVTKLSSLGSPLWRRIYQLPTTTASSPAFYSTFWCAYASDSYLVLFIQTGPRNNSVIERFSLIGITTSGEHLYIKQYTNITYLNDPIPVTATTYDTTTNTIVLVHRQSLFNFWQQYHGINLILCNPTSGSLSSSLFQVLCSDTARASVNALYNGCIVKSLPNGNVILIVQASSSARRDTIIELSSNLQTIVQAYEYDNFKPSMIYKRPDTSGFFAFTSDVPGSMVCYMGDNLQIIQQKTSYQNRFGYNPIFLYDSNGYYFVYSSSFLELFAPRGFTTDPKPLQIARFNWDSNTVDWITTVGPSPSYTTNIYVDSVNKRVYMTPTDSYPSIAMAQFELPNTIQNLATPTPPGDNIQGVTSYAPTVSITNPNYSIARYSMPIVVNTLTAPAENTVTVNHYLEAIPFDIVTDV